MALQSLHLRIYHLIDGNRGGAKNLIKSGRGGVVEDYRDRL